MWEQTLLLMGTAFLFGIMYILENKENTDFKLMWLLCSLLFLLAAFITYQPLISTTTYYNYTVGGERCPCPVISNSTTVYNYGNSDSINNISFAIWIIFFVSVMLIFVRFIERWLRAIRT
jgi:hypothetical protein